MTKYLKNFIPVIICVISAITVTFIVFYVKKKTQDTLNKKPVEISESHSDLKIIFEGKVGDMSLEDFVQSKISSEERGKTKIKLEPFTTGKDFHGVLVERQPAFGKEFH